MTVPNTETKRAKKAKAVAVAASTTTPAPHDTPAAIAHATEPAHAAPTPGDYGAVEHLDVRAVRPSPTNPRQTFDEAELAELARSIAESGLLQPITVRPREIGFEVVAGERRLRAYALLGLPTIPAIVRVMTDAEAEIAQVIENLQRADVSPLEEGEGYARLLAPGTLTVASLAQRVGRDVRYVRGRLALATLTEDAKGHVRSGVLPYGHALAIARLTAEQQAEALKIAVRQYGGRARPECALSLRDLTSWIERTFMLDLTKAPFDVADPTLNPARGACGGCPLRAGNDPGLFDGVAKNDTCLDPACFRLKTGVHVERAYDAAATKAAAKGEPRPVLVQLVWTGDRIAKPAEGAPETLDRDRVRVVAPKAERCEHTRRAVGSSAGEGYIGSARYTPGQAFLVCPEPSCRVHRPMGGRGDHGTAAGLSSVEKGRETRAFKKRLAHERGIRAALYRAALAGLALPKFAPDSLTGETAAVALRQAARLVLVRLTTDGGGYKAVDYTAVVCAGLGRSTDRKDRPKAYEHGAGNTTERYGFYLSGGDEVMTLLHLIDTAPPVELLRFMAAAGGAKGACPSETERKELDERPAAWSALLGAGKVDERRIRAEHDSAFAQREAELAAKKAAKKAKAEKPDGANAPAVSEAEITSRAQAQPKTKGGRTAAGAKHVERIKAGLDAKEKGAAKTTAAKAAKHTTTTTTTTSRGRSQ